PSFMATSNSMPWPRTRLGRTVLWPMTSSRSLRMTTSRAGGCCCSQLWRINQPNATVSRPTATITAIQMRRYRGKRQRAFQAVIDKASVLLLGENVPHAAHRQDALGGLGVGFDRRADAAHV